VQANQLKLVIAGKQPSKLNYCFLSHYSEDSEPHKCMKINLQQLKAETQTSSIKGDGVMLSNSDHSPIPSCVKWWYFHWCKLVLHISDTYKPFTAQIHFPNSTI